MITGMCLATTPDAKKDASTSFKAAPSRSDSTSTVDSETSPPFNAMKQQLFKTKMCRHFLNGRCKYSDKCTFSHNQNELTVRGDFSKTKLCKKANCNDSTCGYAHTVKELRVPTSNLCPSVFEHRICTDKSCKYSHNTTYFEELRVAKRSTSSKSIAQTPASTDASSSPSGTPEPLAADLVQALIQMLSLAQTGTQN
jgi:hypothetical protein